MSVEQKNGFTLVESIVAVALLCIVVVSATSLTTFYIVNVSKKSRALATASQIESAILDTAQDLDKIRPIAGSLMKGHSPSEFSVHNSEMGLWASLRTPVQLEEDGRFCTSTNCRIQTIIDIKCFPSTAYPDCRLAYSIEVKKSQDDNIPPQRLGAAQLPFKDSDYTVLLPYDVFSQSLTADCGDQENQYIMTGFNNNSGQIYCASTPSVSCPAHQIPVGINFVASPLGGGRFEMKCADMRRVSCPLNYVLNRFSPRTLDSRSDVQVPTCVFVGKRQQDWRGVLSGAPPIASTVVCPEFYETTLPTCSATWNDTPVTCGTCDCNCRTTCRNSVCTQTCDTCGGEGVLQPVRGTCNPVVSGAAVAASVFIPAQPSCACGGSPATYASSITLSGGSCQITVPETVPGVVR